MSLLRLAALWAGAMLAQWWWSAHAPAWAGSPQILLALTVVIAARDGAGLAVPFGWTWGLYSDVLRADLFGADALLYMLAGYAAGLVRRQVDLEAPGPLAVAVFLLSWLYLLARLALGLIFARTALWPGWIAALANPPLNAALAVAAAAMWDRRPAR